MGYNRPQTIPKPAKCRAKLIFLLKSLHISRKMCIFAAENNCIMGTLLGTKETKTEKGNQLYEFKRVHSDELQQYRIPTYGYLA